MEAKKVSDTRVIHTDQVLLNDLNNYHTLFGGVLMKKMDACATLSARRHSRVKQCVTASTDSVNFLHPIQQGFSRYRIVCMLYRKKVDGDFLHSRC
jgi:acyl-CoA hydrolase